MAHWLKALATLAEAWDLVPSTHMHLHTLFPVPGAQHILLTSKGTRHAHGAYTCTYAGTHTCTYNKNICLTFF